MGDKFTYLQDGCTLYGLSTRRQSLELGERHGLLSIEGRDHETGVLTVMTFVSPERAAGARALLKRVGLDVGDLTMAEVLRVPPAPPVPGPTGDPSCSKCGRPVPKRPGRGRPSKLCDECRS